MITGLIAQPLLSGQYQVGSPWSFSQNKLENQSLAPKHVYTFILRSYLCQNDCFVLGLLLKTNCIFKRWWMDFPVWGLYVYWLLWVIQRWSLTANEWGTALCSNGSEHGAVGTSKGIFWRWTVSGHHLVTSVTSFSGIASQHVCYEHLKCWEPIIYITGHVAEGTKEQQYIQSQDYLTEHLQPSP